MSNSNLLFNINKNPQFIREKLKDFSGFLNDNGVDITVPYLEPISKPGNIDIVSDFKWTKTTTAWVDAKKIPTLHLKEYYVTHPAFAANISRLVDIIAEGGLQGATVINEFLESNDFLAPGYDTIKKTISELTGNKENFLDKVREDVTNLKEQSFFYPTGIKTNIKGYENLYGVTPSDFKYKIPYFTENFKEIKNEWGDDQVLKSFDSLGVTKLAKTAATMVSTGFGVDFAKMYKYNQTGPSVTLDFFLDNTFDSSLDYSGNTSYQRNWELVFLLLYQNLPARLNSIFLHPPVLYKARVPGVLSYLYSYISGLKVECKGNKQQKSVYVNYVGGGSDGIREITTLIPEAYKVTISLTSLLPETKNLFLDSFDERISTTIESPNNTTEVIKNKSSIFPDGL